MSLSANDVQKVARLSRLRLSENELQQFSQQLGTILDYVDLLNEVNTADVEPMAHAATIQNVFREDQPQPSLDRSAALQNAPQSDGKYFLVPQILEGA
jgi:aspartyl-tRNA(Asn)/glutamyl-tRNA(Gln) amidotransferase subunit C